MWQELSNEQQVKYKDYCDKKYGKTVVFCETGEPLYMDENANRIDTDIIIKLLFNISYQ